MKSLLEISFKNKKALIRVDFNVPLDSNFEVADNSRIKAAKPTIDHVLNSGGSCVLISHLGRPEGKTPSCSLSHILREAEECLGRKIKFIDDCIGQKVENAVEALLPGEVLMLENLRFYKQEVLGDELFSQKLSKAGSVYINDAFGTSHRNHASTSTVAGFFNEKGAGLLLLKEVEAIDKVLKSKTSPVTAIIGGAKVSSKIPIIKNLLPITDNLVIGGGMAHTFIKSKGGQVGKSIYEPEMVPVCEDLILEAKKNRVSVCLPKDVVAAKEFSNNAKTKVVGAHNIDEDWMGLDIGPETEKYFASIILKSQTILWNGPLGVFEMDAFSGGTKAVATAVAEATKKGCFSLVGGGDSVAALTKFNLFEKVSYVSTGGGAMLESLEGKTLPGIAALL